MFTIKYENFANEHDGIEFPFCEALGSNKIASIRKEISHKLSIPSVDATNDFVNALDDKSVIVDNFNACEDQFSLEKLFSKLHITAQNRVYITFLNWSMFNDVDMMKFNDLCQYYDYIWYYMADDMMIFDESLKWFVTIYHDGGISHIQPVK